MLIQIFPKKSGACADPESFVREGPTLTTFFFYLDEGRKDPDTTISGPSTAHQRNAIKMAFRWRADDGPKLNAGLVAAIFQGIRTCIIRKPFVIFQGGGGGPNPLSPPPPSGSAHVDADRDFPRKSGE